MEEITAEYETQDLIASATLEAVARTTVACKTDLGRVRENNEDKFEYYVPEDETALATRGQVYLVCDGMGGHAAGQIASELATKTFIDVYLHHPATEPEAAMRGAITAANRFINDVGRAVPSRKGMGTTLSGLILLQDRAWVVQVGDSRVYRLRNGELLQLTHDHTWVDEAIRQGMITAAEGENHPYKHVLTRALGTEGDVQPDVEADGIMQGDIYLLCSDGLINHVDDGAISETLVTFSPSEAAWRLVGQALQGGGSDNCTVMVVRIDSIDRYDR
jgi:PPM family protein phosphatase